MKRLMNNVLALFLVMFSSITFANVTADVFVKSIADDVITILKKDKDIQSDPEKVYALAEDKILPNFAATWKFHPLVLISFITIIIFCFVFLLILFLPSRILFLVTLFWFPFIVYSINNFIFC